MRQIETNGVTLAVDDRGDGYPIVFIHGFPELAYSWRHQIGPLADEGYRCISYDLRGSGGSSGPDEISAYSLAVQVEDVIGILDRLGLEHAAVVGHDWGSIIAFATALRHPDRISHVASLNVPYIGWPSGFPSTDVIGERFGGRLGYVLSFQEPGKTESTFRADPAAWLRRVITGVAGRPDFMSEAEFGVYVSAHTDAGLTGQLNLYRNIDLNVEAWAEYAGRPIVQPTLMVTVDSDPVLPRSMVDGMGSFVPDLEVRHVADCGHWSQQERPDEVTEILSDWLGRVLDGTN